MANRLKKDGSKTKVLRVQVKLFLEQHVHVAHRADFQILAEKKEILVVDDGGEMLRLLSPQGMLKSLRRTCVYVLGPAPATAVPAV